MFIWFCNLKMSHLFLMKKHKLKIFKVKSLTLSINSNQHTLNRADFFNQNPWDFKSLRKRPECFQFGSLLLTFRVLNNIA